MKICGGNQEKKIEMAGGGAEAAMMGALISEGGLPVGLKLE